MNARWTAWLAVSLWATSMALAAGTLVLTYANGWLVETLLDGQVIYFLAFYSVSTVGVLLTIHRPENPVGWILLAAALAHGIGGTAEQYGYYVTETAPGTLPDLTLLFWLSAWMWVFAFFVPPTFGVLLFPTGRLPSRRWYPIAWLVALWLALLTVVEMLSPGPVDPSAEVLQITNPIGVESMAEIFDVVLAVESLALFLALVGATASVFSRLRAATAVERQQIKWFAYAAAIPVLGLGVYFVLLTLPHMSDQTANAVGEYMVLTGIAVLPVAVGIAILRHNLYDIDRLINRTLVYGSLTLLLGFGFAGTVILFQSILAPFTAGNDLAIAGSTLLVAALFRPLRDRLQAFVDRRFYRRKYDAVLTVDSFSGRLRETIDHEAIRMELVGVVRETMQPASVWLWVREPQRRDHA